MCIQCVQENKLYKNSLNLRQDKKKKKKKLMSLQVNNEFQQVKIKDLNEMNNVERNPYYICTWR